MINPRRLHTRLDSGSVLYAHLLNARHAESHLDSDCFIVLMASNMLWLRPGMEYRVRSLACSVSSQGFDGCDPNQWKGRLLLVQHMRAATATVLAQGLTNLSALSENTNGRLVTAALYHKLTSVRGVCPWSYHEGAFFPLQTVIRFLHLLEASLSEISIHAASFFPEELWLQAYVMNFEPNITQSSSEQVCLRWSAADISSRVPEHIIEATEWELKCAAEPWPPHRFYALKRFDRNSTGAAHEHGATALMLRLSDAWNASRSNASTCRERSRKVRKGLEPEPEGLIAR